jgi:hypothetical protein
MFFQLFVQFVLLDQLQQPSMLPTQLHGGYNATAVHNPKWLKQCKKFVIGLIVTHSMRAGSSVAFTTRTD